MNGRIRKHFIAMVIAPLFAGIPVAAATDLRTGEYHVTQSWMQETGFRRPWFVRVPKRPNQAKLPVFMFLHGNGGNAMGAMIDFMRRNPKISARHIMVFPEGYLESWNIVSERSKADDRTFIEEIVTTLALYDNVQSDNFTIMGNSNGSALVNQLAIESRLPNIRNYISGVSQLNVWQYDGKHFKAKGDDNNYRKVATPAKGKRLLNISGVKDKLVPYHGGFSNVIPAKGGKLAFVDAEESTFVWARHMGYTGKQVLRPSRTIENVEVFRYLDGDVVHYKVTNEGHGATHGISEQLLLDFLDAEIRLLTDAIEDTQHTTPSDDTELSDDAAVTIPISNSSFESGSAGWSGLSRGTSEYYAAPDGTSYAACPGDSRYISQLTNHTIARGNSYTLTVWSRSIGAATNSAATHAEVRLFHGSSTIAVVTKDVYPRRLSGAPATIHNDDGGNVWLDGNYRMSSAQHIFYQPRDKHPINDPWFDAGEHPHGCGMANIMTPDGLNAIYGCTGYNEETLYSGQDFSTFSGSPPFYAFSDVGEPVVCHEDNEDPWIIDAHLYYDDDTGRLWMTWGGGAVYVSELDPRDGFLINHPAKPWFDTHPPGTHTRVAVWGGDKWSADWVEGPSLYKHNGFWYLFLTCGNMNEDYTIRMGRSISPTGSYFDKDGVGLLEYNAGEGRYGNSILLGDEGEYLVPGHPHLWSEKSAYYMGYDYRPNSTDEPDIMGIRPVYWVNDWPTIWTPITVSFHANDHYDAVGQALGISMRNMGAGSTAAFDHVTLAVTH